MTERITLTRAEIAEVVATVVNTSPVKAVNTRAWRIGHAVADVLESAEMTVTAPSSARKPAPTAL